ncbi:MAG: M24 family metallopeptidase, partial [Thermoplasmata archaeon]|nr:M24 family metallopeptidase [Thermoplasmata archaeon]
AQEAGIKAVRAGELARDVDKVARDIIDGYGYGENFTHGLGHGIGVNVHMPPTLSPSSNGVLFQSSDMAITIEPGIYLTGRWGIRLEDDVMVTRTGRDIITHFPKSLDEAILYPGEISNITEIAEDDSSKSDDDSNDYLLYLAAFIFLIIVFFWVRRIRSQSK